MSKKVVWLREVLRELEIYRYLFKIKGVLRFMVTTRKVANYPVLQILDFWNWMLEIQQVYRVHFQVGLPKKVE